MDNKKIDFYRIARLVREGVSSNSICTGYDENKVVFMDERGTIRFHRLYSLEKELSERFRSYSFCAYTSNQLSRNTQQTEVEIHVQDGNKHYFFSLNTRGIEHRQVVVVRLYVLDVERQLFYQMMDGPSDRVLDDIKDMAYDYLQEMPAYRLWFATQDITLLEG